MEILLIQGKQKRNATKLEDKLERKICICRSGCDHPPKVWTHPTMHSKFGVALLFGSWVTTCHSPLLTWSNFWQHSSQYCEAPRLFHYTWLLPSYFPVEL